jgi:hypothetical protein
MLSDAMADEPWPDDPSLAARIAFEEYMHPDNVRAARESASTLLARQSWPSWKAWWDRWHGTELAQERPGAADEPCLAERWHVHSRTPVESAAKALATGDQRSLDALTAQRQPGWGVLSPDDVVRIERLMHAGLLWLTPDGRLRVGLDVPWQPDLVQLRYRHADEWPVEWLDPLEDPPDDDQAKVARQRRRPSSSRPT